jgi:hypothetical protein
MTSDVTSTSGLFPWRRLASECREDPSLWTFVARESAHLEDPWQLAEWSAVLAESREERAFAEATALKSYAAYAALANASIQATAQLSELTEQFRWRSLLRFGCGITAITLVVLTLTVAATLRDYSAVGEQLAAVIFAPAAGLLWRGARLRPTGRERAAQRALAIVAAVAELAALIVPVAFGRSSPYWSSILVVIYLGVTAVFALGHTSRPRLRDIKTFLLLRKNYGLNRRASAAREKWLTDARDTAVRHELTQAINRLRAPEFERRLFVPNAAGLRAVYHEDSQVRTLALQRAENALARSDGASIAIAGPRGSGKSNLAIQLCRSESRFAVMVSAPTQYAPREFLLQLFQELCVRYIREQGESTKQALGRAKAVIHYARENRTLVVRWVAVTAVAGLLIWDLVSRSAARDADRFPQALWLDKTAFYAVILGLLIVLLVPKRLAHDRRREARLVRTARRYLAELRAEQTNTAQVQSSIPVVQATFSRASRSLPWTMPELVGRLREFLGDIAETELQAKRRRVLVCIDEVDRIGSADKASKFLSEVKAIFGTPHCYFVVAIADELGIEFSRRAITSRSLTDNIFDEIISIEPMSFDMCRDLLTRRVLGFTESFVWLSLVLSGGVPRDLIRVARRLVEMTIESEYELRLTGCAEQLVREEIYAAATGSRNQFAEILSGGRWAAVLEDLRMQIRVFDSGGRPSDLRPSLRELMKLPVDLPPSLAPGVASLATRLAALAFLGLTICDAFTDTGFDIAALRDPACGRAESYEDLAAARRELVVSAEGCRAAIEQIRKALHLAP